MFVLWNNSSCFAFCVAHLIDVSGNFSSQPRTPRVIIVCSMLGIIVTGWELEGFLMWRLGGFVTLLIWYALLSFKSLTWLIPSSVSKLGWFPILKIILSSIRLFELLSFEKVMSVSDYSFMFKVLTASLIYYFLQASAIISTLFLVVDLEDSFLLYTNEASLLTRCWVVSDICFCLWLSTAAFAALNFVQY